MTNKKYKFLLKKQLNRRSSYFDNQTLFIRLERQILKLPKADRATAIAWLINYLNKTTINPPNKLTTRLLLPRRFTQKTGIYILWREKSSEFKNLMNKLKNLQAKYPVAKASSKRNIGANIYAGLLRTVYAVKRNPWLSLGLFLSTASGQEINSTKTSNATTIGLLENSLSGYEQIEIYEQNNGVIPIPLEEFREKFQENSNVENYLKETLAKAVKLCDRSNETAWAAFQASVEQLCKDLIHAGEAVAYANLVLSAQHYQNKQLDKAINYAFDAYQYALNNPQTEDAAYYKRILNFLRYIQSPLASIEDQKSYTKQVIDNRNLMIDFLVAFDKSAYIVNVDSIFEEENLDYASEIFAGDFFIQRNLFRDLLEQLEKKISGDEIIAAELMGDYQNNIEGKPFYNTIASYVLYGLGKKSEYNMKKAMPNTNQPFYSLQHSILALRFDPTNLEPIIHFLNNHGVTHPQIALNMYRHIVVLIGNALYYQFGASINDLDIEKNFVKLLNQNRDKFTIEDLENNPFKEAYDAAENNKDFVARMRDYEQKLILVKKGKNPYSWTQKLEDLLTPYVPSVFAFALPFIASLGAAFKFQEKIQLVTQPVMEDPLEILISETKAKILQWNKQEIIFESVNIQEKIITIAVNAEVSEIDFNFSTVVDDEAITEIGSKILSALRAALDNLISLKHNEKFNKSFSLSFDIEKAHLIQIDLLDDFIIGIQEKVKQIIVHIASQYAVEINAKNTHLDNYIDRLNRQLTTIKEKCPSDAEGVKLKEKLSNKIKGLDDVKSDLDNIAKDVSIKTAWQLYQKKLNTSEEVLTRFAAIEKEVGYIESDIINYEESLNKLLRRKERQGKEQKSTARINEQSPVVKQEFGSEVPKPPRKLSKEKPVAPESMPRKLSKGEDTLSNVNNNAAPTSAAPSSAQITQTLKEKSALTPITILEIQSSEALKTIIANLKLFTKYATSWLQTRSEFSSLELYIMHGTMISILQILDDLKQEFPDLINSLISEDALRNFHNYLFYDRYLFNSPNYQHWPDVINMFLSLSRSLNSFFELGQRPSDKALANQFDNFMASNLIFETKTVKDENANYILAPEEKLYKPEKMPKAAVNTNFFINQILKRLEDLDLIDKYLKNAETRDDAIVAGQFCLTFLFEDIESCYVKSKLINRLNHVWGDTYSHLGSIRNRTRHDPSKREQTSEVKFMHKKYEPILGEEITNVTAKIISHLAEIQTILKQKQSKPIEAKQPEIKKDKPDDGRPHQTPEGVPIVYVSLQK